jgi:hypothetical protein
MLTLQAADCWANRFPDSSIIVLLLLPPPPAVLYPLLSVILTAVELFFNVRNNQFVS